MSDSRDIWVILEAEGKKISPHSAALLDEGQRLSQALSGKLHALYVGPVVEKLEREVNRRSAAGLHICIHESLAHYLPGDFEQAVLELLGSNRPFLLIALSSSTGSDLMPRIAFKIQAPLLTNCVDIEIRPDGDLYFIKPVHKNRFHARICTTGQSSTMATLLPRALKLSEKSSTTNASLEIFQIDKPQLNPSDAIEVIGFSKADHRTIDITEAETIVAVGRGVGSEENYKMIKKFADRIGGALAGTRPTVDMGRMPYERQIGQTGKRVSPKLLFLLGISGATEFTKGIDSAGTVVAVNKDRHAPVFNMADLGIVADLENITPKIIEHITELCNSPDRDNANADTYN